MTAEAPAGRTGDSGSEVEHDFCCGEGEQFVQQADAVLWELVQTDKDAAAEAASNMLTRLLPIVRTYADARAAAAEERLAAVLALHVAHLCSCGGRRWVNDQGWEPNHYSREVHERTEGDGLIPCGFCNHGGWNVEQWDEDGAVSCDHCDQDWPCATRRAAGAS